MIMYCLSFIISAVRFNTNDMISFILVFAGIGGILCHLGYQSHQRAPHPEYGAYHRGDLYHHAAHT